jgi:hypothetical protein
MGKITNVLWIANCVQTPTGRGAPQLGLAFSDVLLSIRDCYRDRQREKQGKAGADHNYGESIEILVQAKSSLRRVG